MQLGYDVRGHEIPPSKWWSGVVDMARRRSCVLALFFSACHLTVNLLLFLVFYPSPNLMMLWVDNQNRAKVMIAKAELSGFYQRRSSYSSINILTLFFCLFDHSLGVIVSLVTVCFPVSYL